MRELLDSSTRRRLEILEQLNQTADWISSNELAHTNKASLRTINSDVQYLKENWFPYLIIETSKKNGVRLSTPPSSHASLIYKSVVDNSEAFQLLEKIFFNPKTNIEDWEEEMFISESSLYRIANQLSNSLEHYGLVLQKRPCRVTNHNEHYVRYFYTTYFHEIYGMYDWPFTIDRNGTIKLAQKMFDALGYQVNEVIVMDLAYLIAVSFERISQGFYTELTSSDAITAQQREQFYNHEEVINDLIGPIGLTLNNDILNDLINSVYFIKALVIDQIDLDQIKHRLGLFVDSIQEALNIELDDLSRKKINNVLSLLYLKHLEYPFDDFILFDRYEFNASAIRSTFPTFTQLVEKQLEQLEIELNFPWLNQFKNNVIYWIMVKWKRLPSILENKKAKANLLVFSNLGSEHADLLAELIMKNFGSKVKITVYHESIIFLSETNLSNLPEYDFFVTTFLRDEMPTDKIIVVDAIPSDQDWGKIRRAINQVNKIDPGVLNYFKKND